jgi:replicative DNA helicase
MPDPTFVMGADLLASWRQGIESGPPPTTWSIGPAFDHVEVGPGRIVLLGGAPGAGKTALITQWTFDALTLQPGLRAAIANVEMSPLRLLDRQLARMSGVPLTSIRKRDFGPGDSAKLAKGFERIRRVLDRIAFVKGPHDLERVADAVDDTCADLIVLDYLQRIRPPGRHASMRDQINALMDKLREIANAGIGIIAAAALTRSRDGKGRSSYDGEHLSLASFRESSELEYGADEAFLLYPTESDADPNEPVRLVTLSHEKSRDGETKDVVLKFHRRFQAFKRADPCITKAQGSSTSSSSIANRLKGTWAKTGGNGTPGGSPSDDTPPTHFAGTVQSPERLR